MRINNSGGVLCGHALPLAGSSRSEGADLVMPARLGRLHEDDGRRCFGAMAPTKSRARARHDAGVTRVAAVQAPTIVHRDWWVEAATRHHVRKQSDP
jgi:hypothetical protein